MKVVTNIAVGLSTGSRLCKDLGKIARSVHGLAHSLFMFVTLQQEIVRTKKHVNPGEIMSGNKGTIKKSVKFCCDEAHNAINLLQEFRKMEDFISH